MPAPAQGLRQPESRGGFEAPSPGLREATTRVCGLRYRASDRHRDQAACRVTPATSATFAQEPPSAKDRAETPRHSPTNALNRSNSEKAAGSDRCARASTACRACWARASVVGSDSRGLRVPAIASSDSSAPDSSAPDTEELRLGPVGPAASNVVMILSG
jgi:hypothetical protein